MKTNKRNSVLVKNTDASQKKLILLYSGFFAVMALLIYGVFFGLNGRSLVWCADGMSQHCLALAYYGEYLRTILKNIFIEHSFVIPMFDFSIGYGADIVATLHYYAIGDPLNLLAVFFDYKHIEYLYGFIVVARMYLAGLTFSFFMYSKKKDICAVCTGAVAYAFTGFCIYAGVRHPFFITGLVYCPLVLMGIDRVFEGKSPLLYILSLAFAVFTNFYSAYMICIFMVIYAIIVYLFNYMKNGAKFFFATVGKFALFTVNAMLIPMIIFLPQIYNTLAVDRLNADNAVDLFFPPAYYASMLDTITSSKNADQWLVLGFGGITVLSVLFLFVRAKKYKVALVSLAVTVVMMMFPFFGHVLNGFAYVTNRWSWVIALIASAAVVFAYDEMFELSKKERKWLLVAAGLYFVAVYAVLRSRSELTMIMLAVMFAGLVIVLGYESIGINKKWGQRVLSVLVAFCAFTQGMYVYADREGAYVDQFMKTGDVYDYMVLNTASAALKAYGDEEDFYRADVYKKYIYNASLLNDTNSTSSFFSIANPYTSKFLKEIGLNMLFEQQVNNLNNRIIPAWLTGSKYKINGESPMKSGFYTYVDHKYAFVNDIVVNANGQGSSYVRSATTSSVDALSEYELYETEYYMPMGYTYDSTMTRDEYEVLSPVEKQNVLLQTAVVDDVDGLKESAVRTDDVKRYNIFDYAQSTNGIVVENNQITVTDNKAVLSFRIPVQYESEIYAEAIDFDVEFISYYDKVNADLQSKFDYVKEMTGSTAEYKLDPLSERRLNRAEFYYTTPATAQVLINTGLAAQSSFTYYTPKNAFYSGLDTYVVNLGYASSGSEDDILVELTFKDVGVYKFGEFNICYQSLLNTKTDSEKRRENVLENVEITDNENTVKGTITLDETKLLATQIPYSEGWTAIVDGEKAEVLNVNTMFCGLLLEPGEHTVEFKYVTPYAYYALAMTVAGVIMLIVTVLIFRKKEKLIQPVIMQENEEIL